MIKLVKAKEILERAKAKGLPIDNGPIGWKAAATYLASKYSKNPKSIREIANKFNVTEITILVKFRELISTLRM